MAPSSKDQRRRRGAFRRRRALVGTKSCTSSAGLRPLAKLAGEVVRHAEVPLGAALGNLQLARAKAGELGARLQGPDASSMVGVRQLLERAYRAVQRMDAVVQGTAAFALLGGEELLRAMPRVLLVSDESGDDSLESEDEYEPVQTSVAEGSLRELLADKECPLN